MYLKIEIELFNLEYNIAIVFTFEGLRGKL
jgi:hypothetical protein